MQLLGLSGHLRHGHSDLYIATMEDHIHKFPRTRHIYDTGGGATRDDLVRSAIRKDALTVPDQYRVLLPILTLIFAVYYR